MPVDSLKNTPFNKIIRNMLELFEQPRDGCPFRLKMTVEDIVMELATLRII